MWHNTPESEEKAKETRSMNGKHTASQGKSDAISRRIVAVTPKVKG